ncbi:MAG: FAD-dependent oxidoreductase [Thermodesulfobacteriota bacterium]
MTKKLLLIGGGHAHLTTLARIRAIRAMGHEVTVVAPSPYHYYSGMGPGLLGTTYSASAIRFATQKTVAAQGGEFILDTAVNIDGASRQVELASGKSISYDVLSCNVGSQVDRSLIHEPKARDIFTVKPIANLLAAQQRIVSRAKAGASQVSIVGGGPSAAELAGNVLQLTAAHGLTTPTVQIYCRSKFMAKAPLVVRRLARRSLTRRGVRIKEKSAVTGLGQGMIQLAGGREESADVILLASGVKPPPIFHQSNLLCGPDSGLAVNRYLQSPQYPEIFGGGDCIHFQERPLDKVGVYAVRQNQVLARNLVASLNEEPLKPFRPRGGYLLIYNLGQGLGLLHKGIFTWHGRLAFRLKDRIDRRFMARFQETGQPEKTNSRAMSDLSKQLHKFPEG